MSAKEEGIELEGTVIEALKGKFRVETDITDAGSEKNAPKHVIIAHLSGKLRQNNIRIVVGDRVKVEVSAYDIAKGRITYRLK